MVWKMPNRWHGDMWQLAYPISNGDKIRQRDLGQLPRLGVRDCVIGRQYRVHKAQEIKLRWGSVSLLFLEAQSWW